MSSYCSVAQNLINQAPAPSARFSLKVIEYPSQPGAVYLRVYAHELTMLKETQVEEITVWLSGLLDKLNSHPLIAASFSYEVSTEEPSRWN